MSNETFIIGDMVIIDQQMLAQYLETITSNGMENLDLLSILPSGEEVDEGVMIQSINGEWVIMDMYDENLAIPNDDEGEPLPDDSKQVTFVLIESTEEQALTLRMPLFLLYKEGDSHLPPNKFSGLNSDVHGNS